MAHPVDSTRRSLGVTFHAGKAHVRVWAPHATSMVLNAPPEQIVLQSQPYGYWETLTSHLRPGDQYTFTIDKEGESLADPASLLQPDGVHGPSQAFDTQVFSWTDTHWKNPPLKDYIFYELHTGTFSLERTFKGIASHLPHLKELGITAIEIMPVAAFPGERNWGYDGVFPFAVQHSYGGPGEFQKLINTCHQEGLAVVLDVVYNHLGPEGNIFPRYGPYFTSKYKTPWGDAINVDDAWCDGVRHFLVENVLMWFRDFHVDALRLDAVHAIKDFSPQHILREIRMETDRLISQTGRQHHLIVEMDLNDTRYLHLPLVNGYGMDAQWVDEFHHALRVTTGQEQTGYYEDFDGITHLAKSYKDAYVYDGQYSVHRSRYTGSKTSGLHGDRFVVFSQNHDQVGNRMLGERTSQLVTYDCLKVMAAATILSPFLPLLFMGEEYGETNPFLYFIHHGDPTLIENVRKGRRQEFKAFHAETEAPDPQAEDTFLRSCLQWNLLDQPRHLLLFEFYRELITLRKSHPALHTSDREALEVFADDQRNTLILHRWHLKDHAWCFFNFSDATHSIRPQHTDTLKKVLDSQDNSKESRSQAAETLSPKAKLILSPYAAAVYTSAND